MSLFHAGNNGEKRKGKFTSMLFYFVVGHLLLIVAIYLCQIPLWGWYYQIQNIFSPASVFMNMFLTHPFRVLVKNVYLQIILSYPPFLQIYLVIFFFANNFVIFCFFANNFAIFCLPLGARASSRFMLLLPESHLHPSGRGSKPPSIPSGKRSFLICSPGKVDQALF